MYTGKEIYVQVRMFKNRGNDAVARDVPRPIFPSNPRLDKSYLLFKDISWYTSEARF
jgi:hypothetical protein